MELSENFKLIKQDLKFEKGSILTKEMLCELWAFPNESQDIGYHMYPDGILAGMELLEDGEDVIMKSGLVKYQNRIYRNGEDINLSELVARQKKEGVIEEQSDYQMVLLPEGPELLHNRNAQAVYAMCLKILPASQQTEGVLLSRFRLSGRGQISLFHDEDMKEISKPKFWDMVSCPYSCRGGTTYHPYIFEQVRRKVMAKNRRSALDYVILNQIALGGIVSDAFIRMVLEEKGKLPLGSEARDILREFVAVIGQEEEPAQRSQALAGCRAEADTDSGKLL